MEKMNVDLIKFKTPDGLILDGFISKSKPRNKKIIIHLHGMTGDFFRGPFISQWAKKMKGTDYDLFSINTRGYGLLTKFYCGKKKRIIGTAMEKIEESVYDIEGAIKTAKKLGYEEIIISGHSTGCQKAVYYMSKKKNSDIKALILLSPVDDYNLELSDKGKTEYKKAVAYAKKLVRQGKENELLPWSISKYSAKRYLSFADPKNTEAQLFNFEGELKKFSEIKIPILVVFGENDNFADKNAHGALQALREKTKSEFLETVVIPKTNHVYAKKEKEVSKTIVEFLRMF